MLTTIRLMTWSKMGKKIGLTPKVLSFWDLKPVLLETECFPIEIEARPKSRQ